MTKAPTDDSEQLRPWLHTVIKHEALALRRQRERLMAGGEAALEGSLAGRASTPDEEANERQRALRTAEALGELKSSELRCLLLKALGYSYDEIAAQTGFSWTKVNRSLTEGRKRFFDRFAQIESGQRCEGFRPILSAACDGEASKEDEHLLATHLRGCQSCRAAVRAYRAAPARLAELLPPALVAPLLVHKGGWWSRLYESVVTGSADRAGAISYKLQQAGELLSAQKATAVVASTAALAGGAAVHEDRVRHHHADRPHASAGVLSKTAAESVPAAAPAPSTAPAPVTESHGPEQPAAAEQTGEFTPEPPPESAPPPQAASAEFGPPAPSSSSRGSAGGSSEFGP